jgi:cysteine desulfurase/selenocysteine lyase
MEKEMTYTIQDIRDMFPILSEKVNGKPLVYFDNGATAQKPLSVIESERQYYLHQNANIHRGVHTLSQEATSAYEASREKIRRFLNAEHVHEIIFTSGTTQGINTIAFSFGTLLKEGDEVIVSAMEHHSNIVPWQMACEYRNAKLRVVPMNDKGELQLDAFEKLLNERTRIVAVSHVSNALGTINPVKEIIALAHQKNIPVLLDGAQAVQHMKVDVQELDCDFYVFSGHKLFGPTGTGVLYGKEKWLNLLPPYMGGGDMIKTVTFEKTEYNELPHKFEAGTPNIAGGIALGYAIDFVEEIGISTIREREEELLLHATKAISEIPGVRIIGTAAHKTGVVSFVVDGIHPYDIGTLLDQQGIAVRTGHHCTQPIMDFFGIPGTVRASFAFYNTTEEIDRMIIALNKAIKMLKG